MAIRVVAIGISYRGNPAWPELAWASNDALRLLNTLRRYAGSAIDFFTALEPEHTSSSMLARGLQRFLSTTTSTDQVLFIFAGHGFEHARKSYLVASDHCGIGLDGALPLDEVVRWLGHGQPANRILIIDACHTGQGRSRPGPDILSPDPGISVLASCDLDECAVDLDELEGGLFSFMVHQALNGAAGLLQGEHRWVTVTGLFQYVAREVPAWLASNRARLGIPATIDMTPRLVTDLSGDPILTRVPIVRYQSNERLSVAAHSASQSMPNYLSTYLAVYQDLAQVASTRAQMQWGRQQVFLDAELHRQELELLTGRCLADLNIEITSAEMFVLRAAICLHDLGLAEAWALEKRYAVSVRYIRSQKMHDLPIVLPDMFLLEAIAQTINVLDGCIADEDILWRGTSIRSNLLGNVLALSHRLSIMGERLSEDVGGLETGRVWVRRTLLSGVGDWSRDGAAAIYLAPGLSTLERAAVDCWCAQTASFISLQQRVGTAFGPIWLDVKAC